MNNFRSAYRDYIKPVVRLKYVIAGISIIAGLISFTYFSLKTHLYFSSVRFFVEDKAVIKNDQSEFLVEMSTKSNVICSMAQSSEMFDQLIERFDLYNHFKINKSDPLHYERVTEILQERIRINTEQVSQNMISITVADEEKQVAADIANGIYAALEEMMRKQVIATLEKKNKIYDLILQNISEKSSQHASNFKELISEFRLLTETNYLRNGYSPPVDLMMKLSSVSTGISSVSEELNRTIKDYEISLAVMKKENLESIRLINRAVLDTDPGPGINSLKKAIIYALITASFCSFLIVFLSGSGFFREEQDKVSLVTDGPSDPVIAERDNQHSERYQR
jgi:capsular polysaccharide biosynthesis protein